MSLKLTDDKVDAIETIAENEGIDDYKLEINCATAKGDGYMGSLWYVTLNSGTRTLKLILKQPESIEDVQHKRFTRKAYLREIHIYNNVLREFESFQKDNNVVGGFTAKIYSSSDKENNEFLILEDLGGIGYKIWNRKVPMDSEHVALVFFEYGKLHALSLAMRERKPEKYFELTNDLDDVYGSTMSKGESLDMVKNVLHAGHRAVKDNNVAAESFKKFATNIEKFLLTDLELAEDKLVVIHGDAWCNNIMFKYKDRTPKNVCFIDWQLSKIGSPVLDLAYFLFVCTTGNILRDYKSFLKIYHDAVSEVLIKCSCDVEKLFPYTLLEYHWKKYAKFGLYIALLTLNFMLCETQLENWEEFKESGENDQTNEFGATSGTEYSTRIIDIVTVMAQNDLI